MMLNDKKLIINQKELISINKISIFVNRTGDMGTEYGSSLIIQ